VRRGWEWIHWGIYYLFYENITKNKLKQDDDCISDDNNDIDEDEELKDEENDSFWNISLFNFL